MTLTEREAQRAVAFRWVGIWPSRQPNVPYFFANKIYDEPSTGFWCTVALTQTDSDVHTIGQRGSRVTRRQALVSVGIRGPVGLGTDQISDMLNDAGKIFERVSFDGIDCHAARINHLGVLDKWYRADVTIPCEYYERS